MSSQYQLASIALLAALIVSCASLRSSDRSLNDQSEFHLQLAAGHWDAGEVPQAIEELQLALLLDPENTEAHYFLGFIFSGRNMFSDSIRHYRQALLLRPGWNEVKNNLGVVYLQMERWTEAEELFADLTRIAHYHTPGHAHNNLGWAQLQQGRMSEALRNFEMATYLQPDLCLAYNNQGLVLVELERFREATEAFETAVELCARYAEPKFHLARLRQREGRFPEAQRLFSQCAELVPRATLGRRCREYLNR